MILKQKKFLPALSLIALTGCGGFSLANMGGAPLPSLALRGGAVIAAGPDNYCVAPSVSNPGNGFALLAACDVISGGKSRPSINALITTQVGDVASASVAGSEPVFRAFLETDAGRALLSRTATASTITIAELDSRQGQVTVVFDDTSPAAFAGLQQREWRSFVDVGDRLVTLTVRGLAGDPLSDARARALMNQAVGALRVANAQPNPAALVDDT